MTVKYINRKGDTYYLHQGKTKTGKPKYFFSMKKEGILAKAVPDGYEIYENPNTQVFLRKIPPKIFTDEEIAVVENGVKKYSNLKYFKVDVKKNAIVVFLPDQDVDGLIELLSGTRIFGNSELHRLLEDRVWSELGQSLKGEYYNILKSKAEQKLVKLLTYSPMMRFVLIDEKRREFQVERMRFLGSIDDWLFLDSDNNLKRLVKKYCPHLGKESFYDLM